MTGGWCQQRSVEIARFVKRGFWDGLRTRRGRCHGGCNRASSHRCPVEQVFRAVSDAERLVETTPAVVRVEFLTEGGFTGVGTRFRETRVMGRQTVETELEVVAYDPERHEVRMVSDAGGTTWDTTMSVRAEREGSELTIAMEARGHTWFNRAFNWVMTGVYRRGIRQHLRDLAAHLPRASAGE